MTRFRKARVYSIHCAHDETGEIGEPYVLEHDGWLFETFDADAGRAVDVAIIKVPCGKGLKSHYYSVMDPATGLKICYGSCNASKDEAVARFERTYKSAWLRILHSYADAQGVYYDRLRRRFKTAVEEFFHEG